MKRLTNGTLSIAVKEHGAELCSIRRNGREYLWQAYPEFWKRHSPVLFPIVGSVWQGEYRSGGSTYKLGQHGIARDMDFALLSETENEVFYVLESSEETLSKYPYPFRLVLGYRLHDNVVDVIWRVENTTEKDLYFQIGAHPAFHWPLLSNEDIDGGVEQMNKVLAESTDRGYFRLEAKSNRLRCSVITEGGCVNPEVEKYVILEDGFLPLNTTTFNEDTLIIEDSQVTGVTLCDSEKRPYLTVRFDAPLIGLWSPPAKNAPFVCIEPWYGRTDRVGYDGEYEKKDWIQHLSAGETFESVYQIIVE